ncbi:MAG: VirB3 family type IV secretion system protein [Alphaproteobacteria bacterium]|nr:VirB3 family type IV secretion system protein [Alphaproteobacteria bacterium]
MRQPVLKALANPARIFFVPYTLAVLNFAVQFLVFIIVMVSELILWHEAPNPLWFLLSVICVHLILMPFAKRDPQLGQILASKFQLFKQKIPGRLIA